MNIDWKGGLAGMAQGGNVKVIKADLEKELLPLNVLLHCRTVVEGQNFVTTGVMTNVEGELFEVEIHEFDQFELGETVKMTIYSPVGIQTIPSVVFAKYEGAIALLQPPDLLRRFKERREHPRVEVTGNAQILYLLGESGEEHELEEPMEVTITDVSISGLGFSLTAVTHFPLKMRLKAKVQIGLDFSCELEIIRRDREDDMLICGAKMQVLEPEMLRPLRALILRQQVEKHAKTRKESINQRKFNS
jgi:hypothetical protein